MSIANSILRGLDQAQDYADGKPGEAKTHTPEEIELRAVRKRLQMSQTEFADAFHVPVKTVRGWEQKQRQMNAVAKAYLAVIKHNPDAVIAALDAEGQGARNQ